MRSFSNPQNYDSRKRRSGCDIRSILSGIENDQSFRPLLVHDSISALTTSDRVAGFDLILVMTLATDVHHGLFDLLFGLLVVDLHHWMRSVTMAGTRS
jgi:hypothetical protein